MESHDLVCLGHLVVSIGVVIVVVGPRVPSRAITVVATMVSGTDIRGQIALTAEFGLVGGMRGFSLLLDQSPGCRFGYIRFGEDNLELVRLVYAALVFFLMEI